MYATLAHDMTLRGSTHDLTPLCHTPSVDKCLAPDESDDVSAIREIPGMSGEKRPPNETTPAPKSSRGWLRRLPKAICIGI